MRAEDKVKQKPRTAVVTKTRMAAQPETKLSKVRANVNMNRMMMNKGIIK